MRKCQTIALVCIAVFGCCAHDSVPQDIDEAINGICDAYNADVQQARREERSLSDKIQLIADEKVRNACYLRRIRKMVDSDSEKIDLRNRGQYLNDVVEYGLTYAGALEFCGSSKDVAWDERFKLLSYVRRHMRKLLASVQEMPKGVVQHGGLTVVTDVDSDRRYTDAIVGYNAAACHYEGSILVLECYGLYDDIRTMPEESQRRVLKKFEDFLGRPIRTQKQCRDDHRNQVSVEFPRLGCRDSASPAARNSRSIPEACIEVEFPDEKAKEVNK